jgi:hypothetical protein
MCLLHATTVSWFPSALMPVPHCFRRQSVVTTSHSRVSAHARVRVVSCVVTYECDVVTRCLIQIRSICCVVGQQSTMKLSSESATHGTATCYIRPDLSSTPGHVLSFWSAQHCRHFHITHCFIALQQFFWEPVCSQLDLKLSDSWSCYEPTGGVNTE